MILFALVSTVSGFLQGRGGFPVLASTRLVLASSNHFTSTWVVQMLEKADHYHAANQIAEKHGLVNVGQVNSVDLVYIIIYRLLLCRPSVCLQ